MPLSPRPFGLRRLQPTQAGSAQTRCAQTSANLSPLGWVANGRGQERGGGEIDLGVVLADLAGLAFVGRRPVWRGC